MKLEVHFQIKQVSHGKSEVSVLVAPWETQDTHKALVKLAFGVRGVQSSVLF